MSIKIDDVYIIEKLDAFNVAIETLRMHESADDVPALSSRLRLNLADRLEREIGKWMDKYGDIK